MKTDCVVIGAGPGGYVCAIRLAQLGKKVVLVEKHKLGGECLNYGCIPSKALIFASHLYENIKKSETFGIEVSQVKINLQKLQQFRKNLILKLNQGIGFLLKQNKVDVVMGEASFLDSQKISIVNASERSTERQTIEADHFVLATGSVPIQIPRFEYDGNLVIGSKEALELSTLPERILILGGGVIGLELGTYFVKLGVKVSVIEMMDQLLPGVDKDLVSVVERSLKKRGVDIYTSSKARSLSKGEGITLTIDTPEGEKVLEGNKLLVTIGRKALTKELGIEKAGIKTTEKGFVQVDQNFKTNQSHIYAIGDLIGQPLLAHKATHEGISVAESIANKSVIIRDRRIPIPWAIFTDPEIAGVGLTQEEAEKEGKTMIIGKFPFMALGRSLSVSESEGFTKIVADQKNKEVLGVFIVGSHASDLISEGALAVTKKLTLEDIAHTIHPHPTLSEGLMEAAQAALGKAIHVVNKSSP